MSIAPFGYVQMKRLFDMARRSRRTDLILFGLIVLGLLAGLALLPTTRHTDEPRGWARVIDGDSLEVEGVEIRLRGIDAPEAEQTCMRAGRSWDCGREAARRLAARVRGQQVSCIGVEEDQHGRLLARCMIGKTDLNHWLVEQGWAVAFGNYLGAEHRARAGKRGIWAGEFQRPVEWREDNRWF